MSGLSSSSQTSDSQKGLFPLTEWSAISLARGEDEQRAVEGLRTLAVNYWRPLYLYLRKRGENHSDASDSVQGFFEFVFSSRFLDHVDREGGKFRSYLLKSLERWRSSRRVHERAQKRGGNVIHLSLDGLETWHEELGAIDDSVSPEMAFDRQWASDIVARAVTALQVSYANRGRQAWFEALSSALPGGGPLPAYQQLAAQLETTEGAIRKGVHDLRQAFAANLRQEIRATVRANEDAEDELRYLVSIMATD